MFADVQSGGGIAHAEGHEFPHVAAVENDECCLWPFLGAHGEMMLTHQQVEGHKVMSVVKICEDFVDAR